MQTKIHQLSQKLTPIAAGLLLTIAPYAAMAEKHEHEMEQHSSHEHGVARLTVAIIDDGLEVSLESPAANVFGFEHKAGSEEEREVVHKALVKLKDGAALFAVNSAAACVLEGANIESSAEESHDEGDDHDHEKEEKHEDDHDHEKEETHEDDHDHEKEEKHEDDHDHEKEEEHDDHKDDDHGHEKEDKHDDHDDHEKEEKHKDDHGHDKENKHDDHDDHEKEEKHDEHDHEAHADEESSHSDVEAVWTFHCEKPAAIETVSVKLFSAFPSGFEEIAVEWLTATGAGKTELKEDGRVSLKP